MMLLMSAPSFIAIVFLLENLAWPARPRTLLSFTGPNILSSCTRGRSSALFGPRNVSRRRIEPASIIPLRHFGRRGRTRCSVLLTAAAQC
ncbi:hypothetical protein BDZ89DRAFT_418244 [Hymenopellis radicata]|nr:hypothetical protein BDZ89DRAFT_418244 [Hymenopellis radicata]